MFLLGKVHVKRKRRSKVIKFDCLLRRLKISKSKRKFKTHNVIHIVFYEALSLNKILLIFGSINYLMERRLLKFFLKINKYLKIAITL